MEHVRSQPKMTWADGGAIKAEVDIQQQVLLGPKTLEDLKPPEPTKNTNKGKDKGGKAQTVQVDTKASKGKDKVAAAGDSAAVTNGEIGISCSGQCSGDI